MKIFTGRQGWEDAGWCSKSFGSDYGLNFAKPPCPNSYVDVLSPVPQNVTLFRDSVFKDEVKGGGGGMNWEIGMDIYTLLMDGGLGLVTKLCPTLETPWIVASQAPLSMELSRQEYWSGLPFPSPGDGIEPGSPTLQAGILYHLTTREAHENIILLKYLFSFYLCSLKIQIHY